MKQSNKWCLPRWIGKRRIFGATNTELILALFIGAVMIGYAVPNFQTFIINNRTIAGTNLVVSALNFARSEAIKRGVPVTACASLDYSTCTASVWPEGWMVFTDEPIAGVVDGSDEVLRTQDGVDLDITLVTGQSFIRFAPNGALADVGHDTDAFEGIAYGPYEPSPLGTLVSNLLPISSAYADDDSSDDNTVTPGSWWWSWQQQSTTQQKSSTGNAVFEFKVCPKKAGYTGRTIEVSASGQIRTVEVTC